MANNPYVNKVDDAAGNTIMDITDTTATESDVLSGEVFYKANGQRSTGSLDISSYVVGPSSSTDGNVAVFNGSNGKAIRDSGYTIESSVPANAVFTDTTYTDATSSSSGLMSAADKTKLDGVAAGATANVGTITGITMNGTSKGTSGVVDLGTVITEHQDISGKANQTELNAAEAGYAIVVNGNTAPKAITAGQYLFIKNHSSLASGGYHATAAIASGGSISSSNVAADADGVVNALNSKITRVQLTTATDFNNLTIRAENAYGNMYYAGNDLSIHSHIPSGSWSNKPFNLDIEALGNGYSSQILSIYDGSIGPRIFKRQSYYSGTSAIVFTSWEELALNSKIGLKVISEILTYDGVKFPVQYPPKNNHQLCVPARNTATGHIYILYYLSSVQGFVVATILGSGTAPTEGQNVHVQYGI